MRKFFWVGLIVVIVALALGVGAAYGASLLVRDKIASLPSFLLNNNLPPGQPGDNQRQYNPWKNPGGQNGFGPGDGPMMGPGRREFRHFFNCPVPNQDQNQGLTQYICPPFGKLNRPVNPNNGTGNGPY